MPLSSRLFLNTDWSIDWGWEQIQQYPRMGRSTTEETIVHCHLKNKDSWVGTEN